MRKIATQESLRPCVIGTGLLALDIVVNLDSTAPPRCYAGGTCGNVLMILGYLGWQSRPIGRLAPGLATDRLLADLKHWQISTEYISVEDDGSTPVIVERITRTARGELRHTFSWRCPGCGSHLPGYKPILASTASGLAERLPISQVYFFDRVSRGVLHLAEAASRNGALVVFEPSGVGDPALFREAWSIAHVVKYSHERLRDIADLGLKRSEKGGVLLEVETLGGEGIRYRSQIPKGKTNGWRELSAFSPQALQDAAGSGDWCTAGILHKLGRGGLKSFRSTDTERLHDAIRYGQALATWNCGFEGARGGMYRVDKPTFERQVASILSGSSKGVSTISSSDLAVSTRLLDRFCPVCKGPELGAIAHNSRRAGGR